VQGRRDIHHAAWLRHCGDDRIYGFVTGLLLIFVAPGIFMGLL
jgi:hypothetical protein